MMPHFGGVCKTIEPKKHLRSKSSQKSAQFLTFNSTHACGVCGRTFYMECQFQIHEAQHENQYLFIQLINIKEETLVDGSLKAQELREKR